jgi:hypothetical protein
MLKSRLRSRPKKSTCSTKAGGTLVGINQSSNNLCRQAISKDSTQESKSGVNPRTSGQIGKPCRARWATLVSSSFPPTFSSHLWESRFFAPMSTYNARSKHNLTTYSACREEFLDCIEAAG